MLSLSYYAKNSHIFGNNKNLLFLRQKLKLEHFTGKVKNLTFQINPTELFQNGIFCDSWNPALKFTIHTQQFSRLYTTDMRIMLTAALFVVEFSPLIRILNNSFKRSHRGRYTSFNEWSLYKTLWTAVCMDMATTRNAKPFVIFIAFSLVVARKC